MIEFLLGVAATVLAYTFMPPAWASRLSLLVRDWVAEIQGWWSRSRRRGGVE